MPASVVRGVRGQEITRCINSMGPPPFGNGNSKVPGREEHGDLRRLDEANPATSMGPPPCGSGNVYQVRLVLNKRIQRASMGPPPFGSGDVQMSLCNRPRQRSFNEAIFLRSRRGPAASGRRHRSTPQLGCAYVVWSSTGRLQSRPNARAVSPELVEGRAIRIRSWFDPSASSGLTTNGFSATLQSSCGPAGRVF